MAGQPARRAQIPGKTPEDLVADYLTELHKHVMTYLARKSSEALLQITPIEFWFTKPPLWSIRAENATRNAALKAGFASRPSDTIHMIKEPEAALIACLNDLIKDGESPLVKDLASYEIMVAYPRPSLNQACVSEGGKCGSTTIDRALHRLMRSRFKEAFSELPLAKRGASSKFMAQFESAKRDFGMSQYDRTYRLHLKLHGIEDSNWYDSEDDEVLLTTEDMRMLFDPVVKKIIDLLEQQISATKEESKFEINTTILVGGFGESAYLFSKIKSWYPENIELINPVKSWESICLGAAVRGLEGPVVIKQKCKRHLGGVVSKPFRPGIDDESDSHIHPFDGSKNVHGFMDWIVARGEFLTPETVKRQGYWRAWSQGTDKKFNITLYESAMAVAPEKKSHHSVKEVGEIQVDLSSVNFDMFETKELNSPYIWQKMKLYRVEFEVVIVMEDDLGYMHFRTVIDGKQVGETKLAFKGT